MQVCGHLFEFKNLYRADAPAILPCWELAWGLLQKSAKSLRIVARVRALRHTKASHMVFRSLVPVTSLSAPNCVPADRPSAADVALGGAHHNLLALAPRLCKKYSAGQCAHTAVEAGIPLAVRCHAIALDFL